MFLTKLKRYFLFLFLFTSLLWRGAEVYSQNYPIQITTQLNPPFSGYLPDYSTPGNQNLRLLVLFTDFTKPSYNIKLKIKISGQGINIQNKNYYYDGPFTLQPGMPLEISGTDLADLLSINNLDFSGISIKQYEERKILPEGFYNICFTAYDYTNPSEIKVSNESCAFGWIMLSDPPFLNLPMCGSTLTTSNPQNIFFQWTPMNLSSPNSAANTIYDFELFEVRPATQSPGNIVQTLPPIFQLTTPLTFINYSITEPQLYTGMQYVWRVRARDLTNRDLFKNQGYSSVCTFTYGNTLNQIDSNSLKLNLKGDALTHRLIKYSWDSLNIYTSYILEYRKQGGINWFPVNTINQTTLVNNLEPKNTYEARVKGISKEGEGPWSNTVIITTPAKPDIACGQAAPPSFAGNFQPLKTGKAGQLWNIGQFDLLVTSLNNPNSINGEYSGFGKIEVPFLLSSNLTGKFINIRVNDQMEVVEGKVEILTTGHSGGNIFNLDSVFKVIDDWFKEYAKTGNDTALVNKLKGLKLEHCISATEEMPPLFCSLGDSETFELLKTPTGAESLNAGAKNMLNYKANPAVANIVILSTLNLIKKCVNENKTMSVTHLPNSFYAQLQIKNTFLAGIQYDYIKIYRDKDLVTASEGSKDKTTISPKGKIVAYEKEAYHAGLEKNIAYGVIEVDGTVLIEMPANRKENLKLFLESSFGKNLLLFVSGYRPNPPKLAEIPETKNEIYYGDIQSYWAGIDAEFINRIGTKNTVYADGHHSVITSNHQSGDAISSQLNFMKSLKSSMKAAGTISNTLIDLVADDLIDAALCYHENSCVNLSTKKNEGGFNIRKANGMNAGKELIRKITNDEIQFDKNTDVLDIVCHSFGFAYAQGMIEEFKTAKIKLGSYYIIAPENACSGSVDLMKFEEVWQYGSNLGMSGQDPLWEQDGVAPQCTVGNLDQNRVGIPANAGFRKDFLESHYVKNYGWIFKAIPNGQIGYVKKRN